MVQILRQGLRKLLDESESQSEASVTKVQQVVAKPDTCENGIVYSGDSMRATREKVLNAKEQVRRLTSRSRSPGSDWSSLLDTIENS